MKTPLLAITAGDPSGVGPETIIRAWHSSEVHTQCRPLVIGNSEVLQRAIDLLRAEITIVPIDDPEQACGDQTTLPCLETGADAAQAKPACCDPKGGQAAYDAVVLAADLAQQQRVEWNRHSTAQQSGAPGRRTPLSRPYRTFSGLLRC